MRLSNLLAQHSNSSSSKEAVGTITDNLGDSYLCKNNKIYRSIRQKTLSLGYSFTNEPNPDYLALPMSQLENLLQSKKIPYVNNVRALSQLNQRTASGLDWDHVVDNVRPNYVFHESCHAVARHFSFGTDDLKSKITLTLIEESFANTCEFLAMAEAQDSLHLLFLEMNSYFTSFEDRTHLRKCIERYSITPIFKFMLLCYLHSNFLNEDLNETHLKKFIELSDFTSAPENKILKSLGQNAFALNPRFRYATTDMYLRLQGLHTDVTKALSFDYLQNIIANKELLGFINQLADFIGSSK